MAKQETQKRPRIRLYPFLLAGFLSVAAILLGATQSLADTLILHPNTKNGLSNADWLFCTGTSPCSAGGASGYTPDVALDSNDGDSSYARSNTAGSAIALYMDLDDPSLTGWTINSVQVVAIARATGSSTNLSVGHRIGSTNYTTSRSVRSASYRSYLGPLHGNNPGNGNLPWTWADIGSLIAVAIHSGSSSNPVRVTDLFVKVDFSKTILPAGKNSLSSVWSGAGTISSSGTAVTGGTGTNATIFNTQLQVGTVITAAGQSRTVTAIADADTLTVNSAFSPSLPAGTSWTYSGWAFFPIGSEASALDGHDNDSSYAQSITQDDTLYFDLDDFPLASAAITGVQVHVIAKCAAATVALPCNLEVGLRTHGADFLKSFDAVPGAGTIYSSTGTTAIRGSGTNFSSQLADGSEITALGQTRTVVGSVSSNSSLTVNQAFTTPPLPTTSDDSVSFTFAGGTKSYQRFTSEFYPRNPATLAPWSWTEINGLMGVVNHTMNAKNLRVTQAYISINYISPIALAYSPDVGYGSADGVDPDSGGIGASFSYKIVYTNLGNKPPTSILVHVDGDSGHPMVLDTAPGDPRFHDLDFTNGEQYVYQTNTPPPPLSLGQGPHNYYFTASDGTDSTQRPAAGTLAGPGVAIVAGTLELNPSGENLLTVGDWGFTGGSASTALDTSDGDASFADNSPSEQGEVLYLDMDDSGYLGPAILSVKVEATMCSVSSAANVRLGLRLRGTDYVGSKFNVSSTCGSYAASSAANSPTFAINPESGKAFTWEEINEMVGVVLNESSQDFKVTYFRVQVTHSPVGLSFPSEETGYIDDGVNPDSGSSATRFTYKLVYTNANGTPPSSGFPKVFIDNDAGHLMTFDSAASDPSLADGDYEDGEQFTYSHPSALSSGSIHNYFFQASATDSGGTVRFPVGTDTHKGPAISLPPGSFNLFPSDVADGVSGWSFCNTGSSRNSDCSDPKTALDGNDSTHFAKSRSNGDLLLMSLDNPVPLDNGQFVTSVQIKAMIRKEDSGDASFTLGIESASGFAEGAVQNTSAGGTTYTLYQGDIYSVNPTSSLPWSWTDVEHLIATVRHTTNGNDMLVTQLWAEVKYGPVRLQPSKETPYIIDGVDPDLGNVGTSFKFKAVYYQVNDIAPAGGFPKIQIGAAAAVSMSLDTAPTTDPTLKDGRYDNGEQYIYTTLLTQGSKTYFFTANDLGANPARLPVDSTKTFTGPHVQLPGGTPLLAPTGKTASATATTTGWTFCTGTTSPTCSTSGSGASANASALDTDDGDTSWARSTANGDRLYMDMDNPAPQSDALAITSVQVTAVVKAASATQFDLGLRVGPADFLSGTFKNTTTSYSSANNTVNFTANPMNGEPWTWSDLNSLIVVAVHQGNANEIRVTQLSVTVNYSPIRLTYSTDPRYFDDGVDPNGGTTATNFIYRIVYTQTFGVAPPVRPKVHIDGNVTGIIMDLDTDAPQELQDGIYSNGEQYRHTTLLAAQGTPHNYYFTASDGTNAQRTPALGALTGPVVSANVPTLSFPSTNPSLKPGYELRSAGSGTLTTTGTNTVTGNGTSFQGQLQIGTTITTSTGQTRTVTAIPTQTSLTTDTPFSPNLSNVAFTYATWVGTGNINSSGTSVSGVGGSTSFLTQLQVGSTITAGGQTRTVAAIASATSLTVDVAFPSNLSNVSFTFYTDPALRGVEPNKGPVNTSFDYKIVYTDADNNPPIAGYPRLLIDYHTFVYPMSVDSASETAATLKDGVYTNGEQYTVKVSHAHPGTHSYSFDVFDGASTAIWPLDGDDFLSPAVTDSASSATVIYPTGRNVQTFGFTFQGTDQDPTTALDGGHAGNGNISSSGTTVSEDVNTSTNFTIMNVGSLITAGSQTRRVTAIASDTSITVDSAFSPALTGATWSFDGDYSYARATNSDHRLYMNMDNVNRSAANIKKVQFFAIIRDKDKHNQTFRVGLQIGGQNFTTSYATNNDDRYITYAHPGGAPYGQTNPKTGQNWTWEDVSGLIGVVICDSHCHSDDEMRVTQMYIRVEYDTLPTLSYSPEGGYFGTDGVDPDGWNPAHIYTYKVVYANGANFAPTSIKVHIDNDVTGKEMIHDGGFITNDPLREGDYTNGEQFSYSTVPGQLPIGPHTYYFSVSDGATTARLPASGTLPGPNVSLDEGHLTFSAQAGYGTEGVENNRGVQPNSGDSASTPFVYKVVYTHSDNSYPIYVKVHIDGTGYPMILDQSAASALRDGIYTNGEQYTYTTPLTLGSHKYFFEATDGAKQVFLPPVPSPDKIFSAPAVVDDSPPSAITNLAIGARGPTSTLLTWTAPGNASSGAGCPCGTVVSYNIRYSTLKIVDDPATPGPGEIRFSNATPVSNPPTPKPAATAEAFTVTDLNPNTPYYFAIKSTDEVPIHLSPLSNVINAANTPPIPSTNLMSSWNIISLPLAPSPADVATVFGPSVGIPVNIKTWRSTGLSNTSGSFVDLLPTDTVQAGVGYFLSSPDNARFLNPPGAFVNTASHQIILQRGWNLVGNPYPKDIRLDAICVSRNGGTGTGVCPPPIPNADFKSFQDAVTAGWVANSLYQWDGSTYTFHTLLDQATLRLWQGYWLMVNDPSPTNTYQLFFVKP